jgi:hypothetical protein
MLTTETTSPMLPGLDSVPDHTTRWFSEIGCVVQEGEEWRVFVAGTLVVRFDSDDVLARDIVLVGLADCGGHIGKLARAFGVCEQTVRNLRRRHARGGAAALVRKRSRPPRSKPKLNGRQRRVVERKFELGKRPSDIVQWADAEYGIKRSTVYAIHRNWRERRVHEADDSGRGSRREPEQLEQTNGEPAAVAEGETAEPSTNTPLGGEERHEHVPTADERHVDRRSEGDDDDGSASEEPDAPVVIRDAPLKAGTTRSVQHAGTWLMLAAVMQLGLYNVVLGAAKAKRIPIKGVRLALDALIAALSIGERKVEGIRRVATPTSNVLLRARGAPSAPWVRSVLGRVAKVYSAIQTGMTRRYLAAASASELAVYYVDNHLRPYTGKFTVRKGWRMQDKRVVPGTSDYYVHDIDGRPVLRVTEPSHGHLTGWLMKIADRIRQGLGEGARIVLAFDRGGAFPEVMAKLRGAGVHFVTYERKPYTVLPATMFEPDGIVTLNKRVYTLYENRLANLGKGRGRVRRIAVLCPDGRQINLLAASDLPAEELLKIMLGRWKQENAFKHGNERWGINQLDGRQVIEYPPDTVIPNPARRRLDNAIRIARRREGDARCKLASLSSDDPKRGKYERQLADALADQQLWLSQRPGMPKYVELQHSALAGELVHHTGEYKGLLDIVRIACANAESDFASMLAPLLARPREAKKVLANLLAAPGDIRVGNTAIRVTLAPAATDGERHALRTLLEQLDALELRLPGDPANRRLRFQIPK